MTPWPPPELPTPAFVGVTYLADRWQLDRKTVLAAIGRGQIPAIRTGRALRIPILWVRRCELGPWP